jgi:hypothetical protein
MSTQESTPTRLPYARVDFIPQSGTLDLASELQFRPKVSFFEKACGLHSTLKVPKRENFSLAFFALSKPIWVCELGTGGKNRIFFQLTPDFDGFWFFAAY